MFKSSLVRGGEDWSFRVCNCCLESLFLMESSIIAEMHIEGHWRYQVWPSIHKCLAYCFRLIGRHRKQSTFVYFSYPVRYVFRGVGLGQQSAPEILCCQTPEML